MTSSSQKHFTVNTLKYSGAATGKGHKLWKTPSELSFHLDLQMFYFSWMLLGTFNAYVAPHYMTGILLNSVVWWSHQSKGNMGEAGIIKITDY